MGDDGSGAEREFLGELLALLGGEVSHPGGIENALLVDPLTNLLGAEAGPTPILDGCIDFRGQKTEKCSFLQHFFLERMLVVSRHTIYRH